MNVLIYGGGAVGLGIASCLLSGGESVSILARSDTTSAINRRGIRRTGIFGAVHHAPGSFRATDTLDHFVSEQFDCVLVCTKSFDTEAAGRDLSRLHCMSATKGDAASRPVFVLLQNGWGNRETFSRCIDPKRIYNARVITGFRRPDASQVEITVHADDIHIGHFEGKRSPIVEQLCESICAGGVPCSWSDDIIADIWSKMLYNCSLNSLGAVFEMTYGELADDEYSRELLDRIIGECFRVMTDAGFATHWSSTSDYRDAFYGSMVPATREHYPSTLQDLRAGKRTEIDALNGAVIRLAEMQSLDAPYNRTAYILVKRKERACLR
jgi:2-dehydropantoate 2-reductase